jgi:hypothetical protein
VASLPVPNRFGLAFHHLGLAVHAPDNAFTYLDALGYRGGASMFDPLQGVNLAIRYHEAMPAVEVIWPGDVASPIDNMLKRRDSLIYHLCYFTRDVPGALAAMEAEGLQVMAVTEARPAILFGGQEVSFHHVANFGLIELIHGDAPPMDLGR